MKLYVWESLPENYDYDTMLALAHSHREAKREIVKAWLLDEPESNKKRKLVALRFLARRFRCWKLKVYEEPVGYYF